MFNKVVFGFTLAMLFNTSINANLDAMRIGLPFVNSFKYSDKISYKEFIQNNKLHDLDYVCMKVYGATYSQVNYYKGDVDSTESDLIVQSYLPDNSTGKSVLVNISLRYVLPARISTQSEYTKTSSKFDVNQIIPSEFTRTSHTGGKLYICTNFFEDNKEYINKEIYIIPQSKQQVYFTVMPF